MLGRNHVHTLASAGGAPAPRRPAARTDTEALMARILYVGTSGTDDPTRAGFPFNFALGAVEAGHAPEIFIAGEAAYLVKQEIASAVPAGRTPRRMYGHLRDWQAREPVDCGRMRVFSVDELCPPAPADGYFWRQVRREFLAWAGVPPERCHPFDVGASDLEAMCDAYE